MGDVNMPMYPELLITESDQVIEVRTVLRKEHEGKWYGMVHKMLRRAKPGSQLTCQDRENALSDFHTAVYRSLILGKIVPDMLNSIGRPVFPLLEEQITEEERLNCNLYL